MGQKRNQKLLLIIIVILVILILLIGFSIVYFSTDILKSNKQLFFKYTSQMINEKNGFIDKQLKTYFEKQSNTPYTDEGSISLNISPTEGQEQFENANNMNLTFSGQVNKLDNKLEQNISLNYSDDVQFPLTYKQIGDIIGIQTDYIGSKFITTNKENNSLKEIATQDSIDKIEEIADVELTEEDKQYIIKVYVDCINKQLQDSNFSKVEETNNKGYKLNFNGENIKNIITSLLETTKNDERIMNKLNEYIKTLDDSESIETSDIDDLINNINEQDFNDINLEITVYQNNGKTNKLSIKLNEFEINIEKTSSDDNLQYKASLGADEMKVDLSANYKGLNNMQDINENYELSIQYSVNNQILSGASQNKKDTVSSDMKEKVELINANIVTDRIESGKSIQDPITIEEIEQMDLSSYNLEANEEDGIITLKSTDTDDVVQIDENGEIIEEQETQENSSDNNEEVQLEWKYNYSNNLKFVDSVNIEEYNSENSLLLDDMDTEQKNSFMMAVIQRIQNVNEKQMEELGVDENPIQYIIPQYLFNLSGLNSTSNINQEEVDEYNTKFENYENTNLQGVTVKGLITTIAINNGIEESEENSEEEYYENRNENYLIKEIHFDGEEYDVNSQNLKLIKTSIETESYYRVEFEKDENTGIIYRVVINKK